MRWETAVEILSEPDIVTVRPRLLRQDGAAPLAEAGLPGGGAHGAGVPQDGAGGVREVYFQDGPLRGETRAVEPESDLWRSWGLPVCIPRPVKVQWSSVLWPEMPSEDVAYDVRVYKLVGGGYWHRPGRRPLYIARLAS